MQMDHHQHVNDDLSESEVDVSSKSNKYYLFIKKTLIKLLVPVSLVSFLVSYASGFSFFFFTNINHLHYFPTLALPLLAHALERKYMFLICNAILAFLVKTLNFNTPSLSILEFNGDNQEESITKGTDFNMVSESTGEDVDVALAEQQEEKSATTARADYKVKQQEKGKQDVNVSFTSVINEGRQPGCLIFDYEDPEMTTEEEEEEEEGLLKGASAAGQDQEVGVNINTEELNKKFEEFIRKMKEEIRIQAQQTPQLIITV